MKKDLELVNFKLTPSMSFELIKFSDLKKELNRLEELYNLDENAELLEKIKTVEKELRICRAEFIREFRLNNQEEIMNYLEVRDHL